MIADLKSYRNKGDVDDSLHCTANQALAALNPPDFTAKTIEA